MPNITSYGSGEDCEEESHRELLAFKFSWWVGQANGQLGIEWGFLLTTQLDVYSSIICSASSTTATLLLIQQMLI